ncbi:hypothetical protein CJ030_MR6G007162 [Morella rubra]|uniref:Uncharacterized protein n=1 Tax=Morella rubra TaxID=262757 RepID=A0A6A1VCK4_9ROSI|nr:hypothetical protein CJ030_MR6G007162 [Morella rubra]
MTWSEYTHKKSTKPLGLRIINNGADTFNMITSRRPWLSGLDSGKNQIDSAGKVKLRSPCDFKYVIRHVPQGRASSRELGLVGSELAKFISKNSTVLNASLQRRLIPGVAILKKILSDDENNQNLFRVLRRCNSVVTGVPESRLVGNIAYLKSCGIVGSQLSMLLTRQPWLFVVKESKLRGLVSRVLEMGFAVNTRMLVYALYTVSCMSNETFMRKLELFQSYGFTSDECIAMFRKAPSLLGGSEEKLKLGIEFFINTMKWEKSVLIRAPYCLMYSMETRVFPRFRVLQIMKSKGLLKREPRFINSLNLSEEEFLARFIANSLCASSVSCGNYLDGGVFPGISERGPLVNGTDEDHKDAEKCSSYKQTPTNSFTSASV